MCNTDCLVLWVLFVVPSTSPPSLQSLQWTTRGLNTVRDLLFTVFVFVSSKSGVFQVRRRDHRLRLLTRQPVPGVSRDLIVHGLDLPRVISPFFVRVESWVRDTVVAYCKSCSVSLYSLQRRVSPGVRPPERTEGVTERRLWSG